jgi:hypothetical protein
MKKLVLFAPLLLLSPALAQERGTDASYALKFDAPPAKKGQHAVVKLHITPGAGFHMNKDFPTSLTLTPPADVTVEKAKLTGADAKKMDEHEEEFEIALTPAAAGKKVVTGELRFAVCSANSCDPKKSKVSFELDVK